MEKKKLNLATIETAIKNEAIKMNEKDEKELISFILVDRINDEEKKSEHHTHLHGDSNKIAASIAMRMFKVEGFKDMIYKAVIAYETNVEVKIEKAFKGIDDALGTLIDSLEEICGKEPSGKKPSRRR